MGLVLSPYCPQSCYKPLICPQWSTQWAEAVGAEEGAEEWKPIVSPAAWCFFPIDLPFGLFLTHLSGSCSEVVGMQFSRASVLVFHCSAPTGAF